MERNELQSLQELKEEEKIKILDRASNGILEKENADFLIKLIDNAENKTEVLKISALGMTYKRTGFHFDVRLEKNEGQTIRYLKKNENLSFDQGGITHKLIIGDNYPALLNLLINYKNKIKVIYIDPPYGKDDLGEFAQTNYNNAITRDNLLSMLYPRLILARQLLKDDGVIFCSIDDRNQAYVKCLFDEVFGEENFISNIVWECRNPNVDIVSTDHEYCIVYAKHKNYIRPIYKKIQGSYINLSDYNWRGRVIEREYPEIDENGEFRYVSVGTVTPRQAHYTYYIDVNTLKGYNCSYDDIDNLDRTKYVGHRYYAMPLENCLRNIKENKFLIVSDKKNIYSLKEKRYKSEEVPYASLVSVIKRDLFKYDDSNADLKHLNIVFDYAKPVNFIKHFLYASTLKNDIVLDFFAGSGTTGHAVLELNKQDDGNRQFILVTNNEITDLNPNGIALDVTSKRLKRIMSGECYDESKDFKWLEKNTPYGDSLEVSEIESIASSDHSVFEKIDEKLYGKDFENIHDKIEWICKEFELTCRKIEGE
ncbi:site-specific DNA-methyltransferase [Campylobacter jejuni]|uniref:site-specific DNA-methyltransferase n=1 Tax=Campylobacter jejuni TaxID=197 RepID=UPI003B98FED8